MSFFASICHCQNVIVIEMCQQIEYYIPEIKKNSLSNKRAPPDVIEWRYALTIAWNSTGY